MHAARDLAITVPALAALEVKRRDEDTAITPESDKPKRPRLIISATDEGRTAKYAPIRNFRLEFAIRGNAKVPGGQADPFQSLCGALETLLDTTNLGTALTSSTWAIAVMLAIRTAGCARSIEGDLRTESYVIEVKAVGTEHTAES
jgi:hypothetical protein